MNNTNDLSDIYSAKLHSMLIIDHWMFTEKDIYIEALANNKWVNVEINPVSDNFVVTFIHPDTIRNVDIYRHIIKSNFHGVEEDGKMLIKVSRPLNIVSLRSGFFKKCSSHSIEIFEDIIVVKAKRMIFDYVEFFKDFEEGDTKLVKVSDITNTRSAMSRLYKLASDYKITIKIKKRTRSLTVNHLGPIVVDQLSFKEDLNQWLDTLPFELTIAIPERFTDRKTLAYINTVIHKSKYNLRTRNGEITKKRATLRKRMGKIEIVVGTSIIGTINKASLTYLTVRDEKLIDVLLKPHNLTYGDVR